MSLRRTFKLLCKTPVPESLCLTTKNFHNLLVWDFAAGEALRIMDTKKYGVPRILWYIMKQLREASASNFDASNSQSVFYTIYIKLTDRQILWRIFLLIILMMMDIVETFNAALTFNKLLVSQTSSRCNNAFILSSSFNITDDLKCKNLKQY